jgi:hypothetical protein
MTNRKRTNRQYNKQQNIICYTAISTTYKDSFLLSPFLAILWFHMIIIFLDRPSSITNKTLKFPWQCNPLLSTGNDLTEIRVVNWNDDLSFDKQHSDKAGSQQYFLSKDAGLKSCNAYEV